MNAISLTLSRKQWQDSLLAALSAFCVYACMYAFRKPFTAVSYGGYKVWGLDYKIWLVIAQTIGYTASKFIGISFIGGMISERRATAIIKLVFIAWLSLFFFAIFPAPWNMVFLFFNGLPLGVIYGLVFSYLEGRRTTELLGAVLASSFIFASGFAQSAGKFVSLNWFVADKWMPFVTGFLFFPFLLLFTWLLNKTPEPDQLDRYYRTERKPMNKRRRREFVRQFLPGLVLLISAYVLLTVFRDYRSNFASDIWAEMGFGKNSSIFTFSEIPASVIVLLLMGSLVLLRNNTQALLLNQVLVIAGLLLSLVSTLLYTDDAIGPVWWMSLTGVGLYLSYVPFNCMLFERLIATFRYAGNAGFIIYVADSFGYLGSTILLLVKNFSGESISWTQFFIMLITAGSLAGIILMGISIYYFSTKKPVKNAGN